MTIDTTWAGENVEFIGGADLRDKAELVGIPFQISGVYFKKNDKGVEYCYVEATDKDGEEFDFNDSSTTGVKAQIVNFLLAKGITPNYESGEVHEVNIVIPRGLRLSTYEITDPRTGKQKTAKTYYLTSGGRAARRQRAA